MRAERGCRLCRRGAARPQGGRRSADVRLRRPRIAACERGRAGCGDLRRPFPRAARACGGARAFPLTAGRRRGSGGEAENRRRRVHPRLRRRGGQDRGRALPRPGHAVLGRDRVGRRRRGCGEDQVAPQRRWAAGGHAHAAGRAAAAAVQGRGAARRRGARDARADGLAPALPRPGPRDPDHRRRDRRAARDPAPGRRRAAGGGAASRTLWRAVAVVRRAPGSAVGRRAGRRAHVRLPDRDSRGHERRRHDRRLGAAPI